MITEIAKFVHLKKSSENFITVLRGLAGIAPVKRNMAELWGGLMAQAQSFRQRGFGFIEKQVFSKRTEIHPIFKKEKGLVFRAPSGASASQTR